MIPGDTFPFRSHRSIAEVAETETLRRKRLCGELNGSTAARLRALEARAVEPEGRDGR